MRHSASMRCLKQDGIYVYSDVMVSTMASQISGVSIVYQPLVQAQIKENIKASCLGPLWGECISDWWIPFTQGQSRGNDFHFDDVTMPTSPLAPPQTAIYFKR